MSFKFEYNAVHCSPLNTAHPDSCGEHASKKGIVRKREPAMCSVPTCCAETSRVFSSHECLRSEQSVSIANGLTM